MSVCKNADDEKVNIPLGRLYHFQESRNDESQISVIEKYGYISVIECVAGEERCISVSKWVSVVVFSSVQLWCHNFKWELAEFTKNERLQKR